MKIKKFKLSRYTELFPESLQTFFRLSKGIFLTSWHLTHLKRLQDVRRRLGRKSLVFIKSRLKTLKTYKASHIQSKTSSFRRMLS